MVINLRLTPLLSLLSLLSAIALPLPTLAITPSPTSTAPANSSSRTATKTVQLTLPDVITLLLQNNRDLKNAANDRIVQRQQLREAESTFTPKVQPFLGLGISQTLSNATVGAAPLSAISVSGFGRSASGDTDTLAPGTVVTRSTQVAGQLRTPLGTALSVTVDPFQTQRVGVTVTHPLLRGTGTAVNTAPVKKARFTENRNSLELKRTLTNEITQVSTTYRALARAQEALRIQQLSLENQRKQLEFTQVLVNAGRRARSELVDIEASIAATETQVLNVQNTLEQAKSDLLNLLDVEGKLDIVVPQAAISEFKTGSIPVENLAALKLDELLKAAYANRPEYLQAQIDIQTADLDLLVARDNKRWGFDLQATAGTDQTSQVAAGIVLTRVFEDQSLETAFQQSRVDLLKRQNDLTKITENIKLEVENRLRDVNSTRDRITAARRASELAQRRREIATEKFRRGRGGVDIFQILELQNNVVTAQNEEVNAKIDFLDAVSRLDQAIGLTLDTWKAQVDASGLLVTPP